MEHKSYFNRNSNNDATQCVNCKGWFSGAHYCTGKVKESEAYTYTPTFPDPEITEIKRLLQEILDILNRI